MDVWTMEAEQNPSFDSVASYFCFVHRHNKVVETKMGVLLDAALIFYRTRVTREYGL
jgi:hypothetical protein